MKVFLLILVLAGVCGACSVSPATTEEPEPTPTLDLPHRTYVWEGEIGRAYCVFVRDLDYGESNLQCWNSPPQ